MIQIEPGNEIAPAIVESFDGVPKLPKSLPQMTGIGGRSRRHSQVWLQVLHEVFKGLKLLWVAQKCFPSGGRAGECKQASKRQSNEPQPFFSLFTAGLNHGVERELNIPSPAHKRRTALN